MHPLTDLQARDANRRLRAHAESLPPDPCLRVPYRTTAAAAVAAERALSELLQALRLTIDAAPDHADPEQFLADCHLIAVRLLFVAEEAADAIPDPEPTADH